MDAPVEPIQADPGSAFRFLDRRPAAFGINRHRHALLELACITRGAVTACIGHHIGRYRPPVAFLIGPHLPHTWASDPDSPPPQQAWILQFPAEAVPAQPHLPEAAAAALVASRAAQGLVLTGAPAAALAQRLAGFPATTGADRLAILFDALHAFAEATGLDAGRDSDDPRIARVCTWLEQHVADAVTLADAAAVAGMHPQALARRFRACTGHSLIGWLQRLRVTRACRRLERGEAVLATALATGFAGTAHFHRLFRRFTGTTPARWQREHRP